MPRKSVSTFSNCFPDFSGRSDGFNATKRFLRNVVSTDAGPKLIGSPPQAHEYRVSERREEDEWIYGVFEYKGLHA
jgi:hypothetical protein